MKVRGYCRLAAPNAVGVAFFGGRSSDGHRPSLQFMGYIELHACSAFSFLRGGSFPEQLATTAAELEMPALALLDRDGVYGAQRFSVAARGKNVRPIIGCELSMGNGTSLPVLVEDRVFDKSELLPGAPPAPRI